MAIEVVLVGRSLAASVVVASRRVVVVFIHIFIVAPRRVVGTCRGTMHAVVVGAVLHLNFLVTSVLTLCIVIRHRSAVVMIVLDAAAELILVALIVAIVEVGMNITVLIKVTQLFTKIPLPFWSAMVIVASTATGVVDVVVVLTDIVDIVVDGRVGVDVDGRVGRWVGIVVSWWVGRLDSILLHLFLMDWIQPTRRTFVLTVVGSAMLRPAPRMSRRCGQRIGGVRICYA